MTLPQMNIRSADTDIILSGKGKETDAEGYKAFLQRSSL
jgi:hypothetical protein